MAEQVWWKKELGKPTEQSPKEGVEEVTEAREQISRDIQRASTGDRDDFIHTPAFNPWGYVRPTDYTPTARYPSAGEFYEGHIRTNTQWTWVEDCEPPNWYCFTTKHLKTGSCDTYNETDPNEHWDSERNRSCRKCQLIRTPGAKDSKGRFSPPQSRDPSEDEQQAQGKRQRLRNAGKKAVDKCTFL